MKSLETLALEWLRYRAGCVLLSEQRPIRYCGGVPDCVGVKPNRHWIEIEVKRSLQDFKSNATKRHMVHRERGVGYATRNGPRQFYFIVPHALVEKVAPWLPAGAGLLRAPNAFEPEEAVVVKAAQFNPAAERFPLKELSRACRMQANEVLALRNRVDQLKAKIGSMEGRP